MDNLLTVISIAFAVTSAVLFLLVTRYRRMRNVSLKLETERAQERDAIRLASAKLKFRNILAKQGQRIIADPLRDLYGVDVPTDCRLG